VVWKSVFVAGVVAAVAAVGAVGPAAAGSGGGEPPTVSGPVSGGKGTINLAAAGVDVAPGYVGEEFFVEGTATSYKPVGTVGPDGKWEVEPNGTAPFRTRIVVYRPEKAADFNGTAIVEWLNVSAGFESAPDWGNSHTWMAREGVAWVGVSAQAGGVQGGGPTVAGVAPGGLKSADPERYGTLEHPGDAFSYDIFTQVGRAVAGDSALSPLGDLQVERVIAVGESQSAFRLVTYINAVHPTAKVFDGFLVHSRGGSGAPFNVTSDPQAERASMPTPAVIRSDNKTPVLLFQTETDLTELGYLPSRQKDTKHLRLWEVAGASHADLYTGKLGFTDSGDGSAERALLDPTTKDGGPLACSQPVNTLPAFAVLNAAFSHLDRWVRDGTLPPKAPRMEATADALVRDERGNVRGGLRTPSIDVPLATVNGEPNEGGSFCGLFGRTIAFDDATVAELYPSKQAYVQAFDRATRKAVRAGYLLPKEAEHLRAAARDLPVPQG
jgi:hypothetical protein